MKITDKKKALELAKAYIIKTLDIEVYDITDKHPEGFYRSNEIPKDCWYITCPFEQGRRICMIDGETRLICVCKKTGKVLMDSQVY